MLLHAGILVYINIKNRNFTEEGFTTIFYQGEEALLYEDINLEDYPSYRDFKGKTSIVSHNDPAIVIKYVGRPYKLSSSHKWSNYDVYAVQLKSGEIRKIFKHNLSKTTV